MNLTCSDAIAHKKNKLFYLFVSQFSESTAMQVLSCSFYPVRGKPGWRKWACLDPRVIFSLRAFPRVSKKTLPITNFGYVAENQPNYLPNFFASPKPAQSRARYPLALGTPNPEIRRRCPPNRRFPRASPRISPPIRANFMKNASTVCQRSRRRAPSLVGSPLSAGGKCGSCMTLHPLPIALP